jgi:hypothetical protein
VVLELIDCLYWGIMNESLGHPLKSLTVLQTTAAQSTNGSLQHLQGSLPEPLDPSQVSLVTTIAIACMIWLYL